MVSETPTAAAAEDMELVVDPQAEAANGVNGDSKAKREREEEEEKENGDGVDKKQKLDKSLEEERLEKVEEDEKEKEKEKDKSGPVNLGPKSFETSTVMYDYFFKLIHFWPPNIDLNKYEHLVLLDLVKKGHPDPQAKIGAGVKSFQIRYHTEYKSRCVFIVRTDDTADDFSYRKCVDQVLPLPDHMKATAFDRSGSRGGGGGGRGRGGRGRGGRGRR